MPELDGVVLGGTEYGVADLYARNELSDLKSAKVSKELVNLVDTSASESGYINYDGSIISSSSYKTTEYILVKKGITYIFTPAARFALFFYTDKQVVDGSYMNTFAQNYTFTPTADRYVRISYAASSETNIALKSQLASTGEKIQEGIELSDLQKGQIPAIVENAGFVKPSGVDSQIDAKIVSEHLASTDYVDAKIGDIVAVGSNLYNNKQDLTTGFIKEDGTLNTGGAWDGYRTSDYIKLPAGTYTIVRYPVNSTRTPVLIFDSNKAIKSYDYSGNADTYNTFTLTENGFIRFSSSNYAMLHDVMLLAGEYSEPTAYIPYAMELNADITIPYSGNILFGKKWWACGDSFTEWTTEQFDATKYPNITVVDDRFHYATYPFWIGARNNMTVHNFAVSGQTMAYPTVKYDGTPSSFQNAFSNGKYQTIPADVDYITLWFGINDSHHGPGSQGGDGESNEGIITIGTIDDNATNTFYGAWNTVLEYLITNHPWAKIGIIITNGAETNEYAQAEIAVAKKWGIPYLDLNGDYKLPLMLRVDGKPDVCATAVNIRKNQQWASVEHGNGHPNVNAHKFESTFIEAWLRSI